MKSFVLLLNNSLLVSSVQDTGRGNSKQLMPTRKFLNQLAQDYEIYLYSTIMSMAKVHVGVACISYVLNTYGEYEQFVKQLMTVSLFWFYFPYSMEGNEYFVK